MTMPPRFTLLSNEVPAPPQSALWVDLLRWILCVMDPDDTRMAFVAGCLSHAAQNDGLSPKQAAACQAILSNVCKAWADGILICQNTLPSEDTPEIQPMLRKH